MKTLVFIIANNFAGFFSLCVQIVRITTLSLGAVSNSDVGGHGSPLFPVSCSFDDLDFTDF